MDCSAAACSVALFRDGKVVSSCYEEMSRGQSEALPRMVSDVTRSLDADKASIGNPDWSSLDMIVSTVGPGSFTGLRICLATARGLSVASGVGTGGVGSLHALAWMGFDQAGENAGLDELARGSGILAILDTRRGDFYTSFFPDRENVADAPQIMTGSEILEFHEKNGPFLIAGDSFDGIEPERNGISFLSVLPDVSRIGGLVEKLRQNGELASLSPVYVRPPEARLPS